MEGTVIPRQTLPGMFSDLSLNNGHSNYLSWAASGYYCMSQTAKDCHYMPGTVITCQGLSLHVMDFLNMKGTIITRQRLPGTLSECQGPFTKLWAQ